MMPNPKISVIMGIYNCEETLATAIDSIVSQTEQDWEAVLCDDGSTDGTYDIALQYKEKFPEKFILLRNKTNRGLNYTLNKCLSVAKGRYIARMDGDDYCSNTRFEIETKVLDGETDIAFVSTDMEFFDESGVWGKISHPEYPCKRDFLKESPFCHAPCMVRREAYLFVDGYTESSRLLRVEDYHLWYKLYKAGFKGKNINISLYHMRDDREAYRRRKFKYRLNEAYIKLLIVKGFRFPIWMAVYALKPIIVGLIPTFIYDKIHKRRLKKHE